MFWTVFAVYRVRYNWGIKRGETKKAVQINSLLTQKCKYVILNRR